MVQESWTYVIYDEEAGWDYENLQFTRRGVVKIGHTSNPNLHKQFSTAGRILLIKKSTGDEAVAGAYCDEAILFFSREQNFPHLQQKQLTNVSPQNHKLAKIIYCEWGREGAVFNALDKALDDLLASRVHGFKCRQCKMKFGNKHGLRRHIRRIHHIKTKIHFPVRFERQSRRRQPPIQETITLADLLSKITITEEPMDTMTDLFSKIDLGEPMEE